MLGLLTDSPSLLEALGGELTAAEAEQAVRKGRSLHSEIIGVAPETSAERLRRFLHRVVIDKDKVHVQLACTH